MSHLDFFKAHFDKRIGSADGFASSVLALAILLHAFLATAQPAGGTAAEAKNGGQDIPVPVMTPDLYYGFAGPAFEAGFAGPAFEAQFRLPPKPVRGQVFRSDYRPCKDGLEIVNGRNLFNRPLYSPGCRGYLTAGDRPAFVLWSNNEVVEPNESGWGKPHGLGYCFVGLSAGATSKWFHDFESCRTLYHPGWVEYLLRDPAFPDIEVALDTVPASGGAFLLDVRIRGGGAASTQPLEVVWTHGCLNFEGKSCWMDSYDIQSRSVPWDEPDRAGNDRVRFQDGLAVLQDEKDLTVWAAVGSSPAPEKTFTADAAGRMTNAPDRLFETPAKGSPVAAARIRPQAKGGSRRALIALDWGWKSEPGAKTSLLLTNAERALADGKAYFEQRPARIAIHTPDAELDTAFRFATVAADSMWHPPGISHGAYSWGGLTTIFRIFYGPTCCGDHERVDSALRLHCGVNANGQLLNLAASPTSKPTVTGYESYGSTVDMLWHHYLWTGDREILRLWRPIIDQMLAFEEKERKDARGLFIDHLGFWCSDSFDYREGCAVGSTFIWRMYQLRGKIAEALEEDGQPFLRRAEEIRERMNSLLWWEEGGFFYDLIPADGEKLPAAIAPAIYHPIEYSLVEGRRAQRMMDWLLARLTSADGVVRVDDWFPINWSHNVYSPLETGNAAVAAFRVRRGEAGFKMLKSIVKGTMHGAVVPGSVSCHASSQGYTRNGTDFGDGVSLFLRATIEGLFGVEMDVPKGLVTIAPNFPGDWDRAELGIPDVPLLKYCREGPPNRKKVTYEVKLARPSEVLFSLPLDRKVVSVRINGKPVAYKIESTESGHLLQVRSKRGTACSLELKTTSKLPATQSQIAAPKSQPAPASQQAGLRDRAGFQFETIDLGSLPKVPFADIYKLYPGELTWNLAYDKEPRRCQVLARYSGGPVSLVAGSDVPFAMDARQVVAIRKGAADGVWGQGLGAALKVPDVLTVPVGKVADEVVLLASGLCSPMTCHLPQLCIELRYEDGEVVSHVLRSPREFDFIEQHTSVHPAVSVGWFGRNVDLDQPSGSGTLLHADVIRLDGRRGTLKEIGIRALRRHSGLVLYGVTIGRQSGGAVKPKADNMP